MTTCRSCSAEVVWVTLISGKSMPLDPQPVPDGTVIIDGRTHQAQVIAATTPMPVGVQRFAPHFATCPNADQHRRTR